MTPEHADTLTDEIRINEYDRTHIERCLSTGTWWSADLLRLIAKSDPLHRAALRRAFPSHVEAFEAWNDAPYVPESTEVAR